MSKYNGHRLRQISVGFHVPWLVPDDYMPDVPTSALMYGRFDESDREYHWLRSIELSFSQNVDWSGGSDVCWPWRGEVNPGGYGSIYWEGRTTVTRVMWLVTYGPIPTRRGKRKLFVCHKCDNPWCVNPFHLFLGTAKQNTRDMLAKGRAAWQRVAPARPSGGRVAAEERAA